jgi:hypothetical protein
MGRARGSANTNAAGSAQQRGRVVQASPPTEESRRLWKTIGDIAGKLGSDWTLVGGLMVQLHAFEYGADAPRPTQDIDILADARQVPSGTEQVAQTLTELGFQLLPPTSLIEPGVAFVFERDGQTVDVLAPDGIKPDGLPLTTRGMRTVPIPRWDAGAEALRARHGQAR